MKFTQNKEKARQQEEEFIELKRTVDYEKNDLLALTIAALTTLLPMLLVVVGAFVGIIWLLFLR